MIQTTSSGSGLNTFANPLRDTYRTWIPFIMPTEKVGIRSIAVTSKVGSYMASGYALLVFMICGFAWQLVVYLVLLFYPTEEWSRRSKTKDAESHYANPTTLSTKEQERLLKVRKRKANRYITLITIRNATNPSFAVMMMLFEHILHMCFRANDRLTGACDIVILIAALVVVAGSSAAGTLVPKTFQIGTVAPVNPWKVYYGMPASFPTKVSNQKTKTAAAQRAIGIVSSAGEGLQKRVNVYGPEVMDWTGPGGEVVYQTTYDYRVTGLDFGLQLKHATDFVLSVTGACTIQYGLSRPSSNPMYEIYSPFNTSGSEVYLPTEENTRPVGGYVVIPPDQTVDQIMQPNRTYVIIPDTLGRWSFAPGTDPWYNTTDNPAALDDPTLAGYIVASGRPVLYCWQQDIWSYKGHFAKNASDLGSLPGLDLPDIIGGPDGYIPYRLLQPMITDVAASLGASILVSSTVSPGGDLNATQCSHFSDLKHLILASFLVTQNILRDAAMVADTSGLYNNATEESTGLPKPGTGYFVVSSGDVVTLSVNVLIGVPFIWFFLQLARMCFSITKYTHRNSGIASRFTLRSVGLQNVQIYRMLDEEVCGYRNDWFERKGQMPYIRKAHPVQLPAAAVTSVRQHDLYIAPKVVEGHDGYHLKFTGPVGYEPEGESKRGPGQYNWSWNGRNRHAIFGRLAHKNHPGVVNKPHSSEFMATPGLLYDTVG